MSVTEEISEEALVAALEGEYGEDVQLEAEEFMAENNLVMENDEDGSVTSYGDEEDYEDEDYYEDYDLDAPLEGAAEEAKEAILSEIERVEHFKGRRLTGAEAMRLVDSIPEGGPIPDLVEKYGKEIKNRTLNKDDRIKAMVEAAEDASAEAEEAEPTTPPSETFTKVDERDERVARMVAAGEQATAEEEAENPEPALTPAGHSIGDE